MKIRYAHTNIVAHDWRRLSSFYINVFNCKEKPPIRNLSGYWLDVLTGIPNARIHGIHLLLPGFGIDGPTLEIFQYNDNIKDNKNINKEGFGHIAFSVEDVEESLQKVIKNGGSTVGEIIKTEIEGVGKIHVVYAKDPENNVIEIQKWE